MSFKNIASNSKEGFDYSSEMLLKLKKSELSILKDFIFVCDKYRLKYIVFYGTLLGAVRHAGFIPWDDDIDISMPFDDIKFLVEYFKFEFGDKYSFYGLGYDDKNDPFCGIKICLNGTVFKELTAITFPYSRGIGIDVFPAVCCPTSIFKRTICKFRFWFLTHLCSVKFESEKCKFDLKRINDETLRKYIAKRRQISRLFFMCKYERVQKKRISFYKKQYNSKLVAIDGYGYSKEYSFLNTIFDDVLLLKFESMQVKVPKDYDYVLRSLYGNNYMEIPPIEQRETHKVLELKFLDE